MSSKGVRTGLILAAGAVVLALVLRPAGGGIYCDAKSALPWLHIGGCPVAR
jgi:hypothetical protein